MGDDDKRSLAVFSPHYHDIFIFCFVRVMMWAGASSNQEWSDYCETLNEFRCPRCARTQPAARPKKQLCAFRVVVVVNYGKEALPQWNVPTEWLCSGEFWATAHCLPVKDQLFGVWNLGSLPADETKFTPVRRIRIRKKPESCATHLAVCLSDSLGYLYVSDCVCCFSCWPCNASQRELLLRCLPCLVCDSSSHSSQLTGYVWFFMITFWNSPIIIIIHSRHLIINYYISNFIYIYIFVQQLNPNHYFRYKSYVELLSCVPTKRDEPLIKRTVIHGIP